MASITISSDGSCISYLGHELDVENAIFLNDRIQQLVISHPDKTFILDLDMVKSIEFDAAQVLAEVSDIERAADYPYIFDLISFGLEQLSEELAKVLAKLPSYFLHFDQITSLQDNVARQFKGSDHALTFNGCSEFSPITLKALSEAACFLSLGLSSMNIEQAKALINYRGDLCLKAEQLPMDVLHELGDKPNLCLAPHYGLTLIGYGGSESN